MSDTDTTTLRARLVDLLRQDGRSAAAVARAAGIPQQTLASLVAGDRSGRRPAAELVTRLARELGLTPRQWGEMLYECYPQAAAEGRG